MCASANVGARGSVVVVVVVVVVVMGAAGIIIIAPVTAAGCKRRRVVVRCLGELLLLVFGVGGMNVEGGGVV